jgi:hypothetical protein
MVNGISEKRRVVETASEGRLVEMLIVRAPAQAFYVQPHPQRIRKSVKSLSD